MQTRSLRGSVRHFCLLYANNRLLMLATTKNITAAKLVTGRNGSYWRRLEVRTGLPTTALSLVLSCSSVLTQCLRTRGTGCLWPGS